LFSTSDGCGVLDTLGLFWLKEGMALEETNAALIGLLGVIVGYLGASLKDLTGAIASNPSDAEE